ncbi:hypothetical protein DID80_06125 [Candidatus Marinamargulisbacteria bacterium SCGC AAA071-K20]|nr:hypothetical protein DID80_06125 [Candidatus Marinamargulisbacteria bacterium SCGC AAA071-K20]
MPGLSVGNTIFIPHSVTVSNSKSIYSTLNKALLLLTNTPNKEEASAFFRALDTLKPKMTSVEFNNLDRRIKTLSERQGYIKA